LGADVQHVTSRLWDCPTPLSNRPPVIIERLLAPMSELLCGSHVVMRLA
jgi:hypothetical protein